MDERCRVEALTDITFFDGTMVDVEFQFVSTKFSHRFVGFDTGHLPALLLKTLSEKAGGTADIEDSAAFLIAQLQQVLEKATISLTLSSEFVF